MRMMTKVAIFANDNSSAGLLPSKDEIMEDDLNTAESGDVSWKGTSVVQFVSQKVDLEISRKGHWGNPHDVRRCGSWSTKFG
jgi:hypothetical protein